MAESRARLGLHAGSEVGPGTPVPRNERALDRPARPARRVCGVAMPRGPVEDEQRARIAARQHLPGVFGPQICKGVLRRARPPVRARHEAGCAVVGPKLIDHQDEAEERPIGGAARNVNVQVLGGRARPQRPRVQRTELERSADDAAARLEQRRKYVEGVELGATIHEIVHLRRGAADLDVVAGRRRHGGGVCVGQRSSDRTARGREGRRSLAPVTLKWRPSGVRSLRPTC